MGLVNPLGQPLEPSGGNRDVPRNGRRQPLIKCWVPAPIKKDPGRMKEKLVAYTRMTTYIDCLEDKSRLYHHGRRMVLVGLSRLSEAELGNVLADVDRHESRGDRKRMQALADRLYARGGGNDKSRRGNWLHDLSDYVDRREPLPARASDDDVLDMAAYRLATADLVVKRIEEFTVLDEFKVGGTPDRISFYDGPDPDGQPAGHLITDLKTGSTEWGALKMAMQLAGYSRAKLYDPVTGERTDMPDDLNQRWGLIINLPAGTGECEILWIDLTLGWEAFMLAKYVRAVRTRARKAFRSYPASAPVIRDVDREDEEEGE